ncbi:hypothetical protein [Sporosarcina sp. D27]|uniref:hypothetical protein n=1 Tax=Sporosarcina sp. D27 TaxID=1382305 RepID=UPI0012DCE169|nr:hypothetical protein [Sporosarcina sp. D27]
MKFLLYITISVVIGFILGEGTMGALIGSIAGLLMVIIDQINLVIKKLNILAEKTKI